MFVYGHDDELAEWLCLQLGTSFAQPFVTLGVIRGDALVAAALYNGYEPPNIHMTIAATTPRWASKQVIGRMLAYPFCELRCTRISAMTRMTNNPARAFLTRLGFRSEGFHPGYFWDGDGVSYGLLKRDALKWIEAYNEQRPQDSPTARPANGGGCADFVQHPDGVG